MWRFHDLGFIHGDFHYGNGAFKKIKQDEPYSVFRDPMTLIDFGYAQFIPQDYGGDENRAKSESLDEAHLSPWNLEHKRLGRRDDLYRVLQTAAWVLYAYKNGEDLNSRFREYWEACSKLNIHHSIEMRQKEADEALALVKRANNFFDPSVNYFCCKNFELTGEMNKSLEHLKDAFEIVMEAQHVDTRPSYETIIQKLDMAIASSKPDAGDILKEILEEDSVPLPNIDYRAARQIRPVEEHDEDPIKDRSPVATSNQLVPIDAHPAEVATEY